MTYSNLTPSERQFITTTIMAVNLVIFGSIFFHYVEGWSWLDSTYFTVISLTTVGYGDFSPKTPVGKVGTMLLIVLGISIIVSFLEGLSRFRIERKERRLLQRHSTSKSSKG